MAFKTRWEVIQGWLWLPPVKQIKKEEIQLIEQIYENIANVYETGK